MFFDRRKQFSIFVRNESALPPAPPPTSSYFHLTFDENQTSIRDDRSWNYSSHITIPNTLDSSRNCQDIEICWKVIYAPDRKGVHRWKTSSHLCNLPHLWLPQNGSEFFKYFVHYIRERWTSLFLEAIRDLGVQASTYRHLMILSGKLILRDRDVPRY